MDWQLTCRVCLETGDMVSLFDWDENNEQLADKFTYCCGLEVTKNDSLPTLICLNCVDRLTFAYQFKQQCLTSNETLKECLEEFEKSSLAVATPSTSKAKETITIKQENGLLLQYELPVEHDPTSQWALDRAAASSVVTKAPGPKKRGRPRKYPNEQGQIDISPYNRKKPRASLKEEESLASLLESGRLDPESLKEEPPTEAEDVDDEPFGGDFPDDDPDFTVEDVEEDDKEKAKLTSPKKRGRPRKKVEPKEPKEQKDLHDEDVLLKETIMAFSEPIPEHILNPKPKQKKYTSKKKYVYEKTHVCETCGASFTSNASLQAHIRRHLGIKPFVCSVCCHTCVTREALKRHMWKHTGERPYKCRLCERAFSDFGQRTKHESVCCHTCATRQALRRHMWKHTGERPYKCRLCERTFNDFGSRTKHESVCGYSCVMNEELKRHMLRHTGEKPYKCRICDRRFGDYGTRQKHERLHMGLRPYQCSLCSKSFTYSYVLSNHMLTHTGEKKYSCAPCNKKFTKAHHLKYHNKVHHKELYMKQQLEAEAKKMKEQMNLSGLANVLSGQIVDGTLQIVHAGDDGENESQMQVVEEEEADETHQAVADMQAVVLDSEFSVEDDEKGN